MWDTAKDYRILIAMHARELFLRTVQTGSFRGNWNKKAAIEETKKMEESEGKVNLTLMLGEELVEKGKDASVTIRQVSKEIKGGGGGQKHFATAGGKDASGLAKAVELIKEIILA